MKFIFSFVFFGVAFLQAQVELDSLVVSANRVGLAPELTGRRVVQITAEDIAKIPAATLDDVLRMVAGVEIQSRGGLGVQSDFTIRGSGFNGVLLLIDGVRFNDPQTGHFLSDFPIPLHEIAKIEVLQGAAAAFYGPDAVGGVIHVFTKTATLASEKGVMAGLGGGSYGYNQGDFNVQVLPKSGWKIGAAFNIARADGQTIRDVNGTPVSRRGRPLKTDFDRVTATLASHKVTDNRTYFARFGYDNRDFSAFHFYTNFASDSARENTTTAWLQGGVSLKDEGGRVINLSSVLKQHEDQYVYNPLTAANIHTSRLWQVDANFLQVGNKLQLTSGISARWQGIESNNLGTHADVLGNVHAALTLLPSSAFSLTVGSGAHYHPTYGLYALPQAQFALNFAKATFRASVAQAVRTPDYTERYINRALVLPRGRNYGNPDLKPETSLGFDAGLALRLHPTFLIQFGAFQRKTENVIDWSKNTAADTVWLARNILTVENLGAEVSLQTKIEKIQLHINYNFLDAKLDNPNNYLFKYALNNAKHVASIRAIREIYGFQTMLQGFYKKPLLNTAKDYVVFDVKATNPFDWDVVKGSFWLEVRNILNKSYADLFDAQMPKRGFYAGFNFKF